MTEVVQLEQKVYVRTLVFGGYDSGKSSLIAQLSMGRETTRNWISNYVRDDAVPPGAPEPELRALGLKAFVEHQNKARRLPTEIESHTHRWILADTRGHRDHFAYFITSITGNYLGLLVVTPEGIKSKIEGDSHLQSQLAAVKAMGIKNLIVVVNFKEMELERPVFSEVKRHIDKRLASLDLILTAIIPISVHHLDNIFVNQKDTFYTGASLLEALENVKPQQQQNDNNNFRFTCDYVHKIRGAGTVVSGTLHSGSIGNRDGLVYVTPHATEPIQVKTIEHLRKQIFGPVVPGNFISINLQCPYTSVPRRSILLKNAQSISLPVTFTGTFCFLGAPSFPHLVDRYTPSFHFNINNSPAVLVKVHSILKKGKVVKEDPKPSEIVAKTIFSATFELRKPTQIETFRQSRTFGSCVTYDNFYVTMVGVVTDIDSKQFPLSKQFLDKAKVAQQQPLLSGRLTKAAGRS